MTIKIDRALAEGLGFDLARAVADFKAEVDRHSWTMNEPAPTAHPLVESIARSGESFILVDDLSAEATAARKQALSFAVVNEGEERAAAILSPARRYLAELDAAALRAKAPPSPDDEARLSAIEEGLAAVSAIQRKTALLLIEIEDLTPQAALGWAPAWEA